MVVPDSGRLKRPEKEMEVASLDGFWARKSTLVGQVRKYEQY
jgi:hypothetical protein